MNKILLSLIISILHNDKKCCIVVTNNKNRHNKIIELKNMLHELDIPFNYKRNKFQIQNSTIELINKAKEKHKGREYRCLLIEEDIIN